MVKHFCEPCSKFFRDKNGLICHRKSDKHRLQVAIFERKKEQYREDKSRKFQKEFLELLRVKFPNKRMKVKDYLMHFYSNKNVKIK